MLILGHYLLTQNSNFCFINESKKLKKDQISCFLYNEEIIQNAKNENLDFAVLIQDKNEIFLSNALGAKFLLFDDENLARFASEVAEFYLFDSKILLLVENLHKLEKAYKLRLDGVILKSLIQDYH
ncbi:TPA: hypothetical protein RZK30_001564 [Campylobacter coli]|nr:hypothetical protein [Campylobacter coli]HEB9323965.1 hypothetical protein [Campylobacter coli]